MTLEQIMELTEAREWAASGAARVIRESRRLSLGEVARSIGVSPSTILRWERGELRPTGDAGLAYARLLRELMKPPGSRSNRRAVVAA